MPYNEKLAARVWEALAELLEFFGDVCHKKN